MFSFRNFDASRFGFKILFHFNSNSFAIGKANYAFKNENAYSAKVMIGFYFRKGFSFLYLLAEQKFLIGCFSSNLVFFI